MNEELKEQKTIELHQADFDDFDDEIDFWGKKEQKKQEGTTKKVESETKYYDDCDFEDDLIGGTEEQKTPIDKSEQQTEQIKKEVINLKEEQQVAKPCEQKETIKDIDSLTVEELINELNIYRFKNGISQLRLSKELKLSITTVNNWLCKRVKPSMLHSFKIKEFLKENLKKEEK